MTRWLSVGICLAVFLTQFLAADLKGLWGDEVFRLRVVNGVPFSIAPDELRIGTWNDVMDQVRPTNYQPGYYLALNGISRLASSRSPILFRALNALFCLATLLLLVRLFGGFRTRTARLGALLFFGLNGNLLMHVNQTREYVLTVLLIAASSMYFFWLYESLRFDNPRKVVLALIGYSLIVATAFYVQVLAFFFCALQPLVALTRFRDRRRFVMSIWGAWCAVSLSVLPWLVYKTGTYGPPVYDASGRTLDNYLQSLWSGWLSLIAGGSHSEPAQVYTAGILGFVAVTVAAIGLRSGKLDLRAAYAVLCIAAYAVFQWGYFFLVQPYGLLGRYFIAYLFFLAYLVGYGLDEFESRWRARGWLTVPRLITLVVVVSSCAQIANYYRDPYEDTLEDYRGVAAQLRSKVDSDDLIVGFHPWSMDGIRFYWIGSNRFIDIYPPSSFGGFDPSVWGTSVSLVVLKEVVDEKWLEEVVYPSLEREGYRRSARVVVEPRLTARSGNELFEFLRYTRGRP